MYVSIKNVFRKVQAETRRREEFQVRECQVATHSANVGIVIRDAYFHNLFM